MREEQWRAIVECDAAYDGQFYYAVATTGIYCRPSCKSRTPKPENVRIFTRREEAAEQYRPCKRCRPDAVRWPDEELAERVRAVIGQRYAETLTLQRMAEELHVSPYHLHHVFKRVTGQTPNDVLVATRLAKAKELLTAKGRSVTEVAGAVGYGNAGHFATVFVKHVGVSPREYREGSR